MHKAYRDNTVSEVKSALVILLLVPDIRRELHDSSNTFLTQCERKLDWIQPGTVICIDYMRTLA